MSKSLFQAISKSEARAQRSGVVRLISSCDGLGVLGYPRVQVFSCWLWFFTRKSFLLYLENLRAKIHYSYTENVDDWSGKTEL